MDTENRPDEEGEREHAEHLSNVDDGCGCTEIWERLAETRASE